MAHTTGPWWIEEFRSQENRYVIYETMGRIAVAEGACATAEANARLIAAAPDLLAACVAIAKDIRRLQFTDGEVRLSERSLGLMLELLEREIDKAMEGTNGKKRSLD